MSKDEPSGTCRHPVFEDIKYLVLEEISVKSIWEILYDKYTSRVVKSKLWLKMKLYNFENKKGSL